MRADRFDREPDLLGVAFVLGAGRQASAPHAEVDQRHDVLEQHLLDPDLLDLAPRRPLAAPSVGRLGSPRSACSSRSAHLALQHRCRASRRRSPRTPRMLMPGLEHPSLALSAIELCEQTPTLEPELGTRRRRPCAAAARPPRRRGRPRAVEVEQLAVEPVADRPPQVLLDQAPRDSRLVRDPGVDVPRRLRDAGRRSAPRAPPTRRRSICASQIRTSTVPNAKWGRIDHHTCVYSTIERVSTRNWT